MTRGNEITESATEYARGLNERMQRYFGLDKG